MPSSDYPNRLNDPAPHREVYPARLGTLAILVLVCLGLRAGMAARLTSVDPDGVLYIQLAQAWDAGDLRGGTEGIGLNTYPVILMLVHRAGLAWETAGVVWGVVIASLVVLPLFGWVRRQFDDRVALAACLLYAVHPKTIAWSPELTRDPTFWFLMALSLYLLWRAVTEVRLRWFLAAGGSLMLTVMTRFEGFLLLIPLVLWTFWRLLALSPGLPLKSGRLRLVLGVVLCVGAIPALALVAASLWLGSPWDHLPLRFDPWERLQSWLAYLAGGPSAAEASLNPLVPDDVTPMSLRAMLRSFFPIMTRGLGPAYALLMFGGIWGWRRIWARRDHQPLFYAAIGVLVGIWIHLWYDRAICPRYALSIVLWASPFAALGLLGLMRYAARAAERIGWATRGRVAAAGVAVALVVAIGVGDAFLTNRRPFALRKLAADLGRWVHQTRWPAPRMVGPVGMTPIVHYYAGKGRYEAFRIDTADAAEVAGLVERVRPHVLLLRTTRRIDPKGCEALVARMESRGYSVVEPVERPAGADPVVVLVRGRAGVRVATRPQP